MGVQDFFTVLRDECPEVLHPMKISNLKGISVSIDISIFFNNFVRSKTDNWIDPMVRFLTNLKKNKIAATFIFDGVEVPIEKQPEQQRRRENFNKQTDLLERGKELLPLIAKHRDLGTLPSEDIIEEIKVIIGPMRAKKMETDFDDIFSIHPSLITALSKREQQTKQVLPDYTPIARDFIESFGFDHFTAKGEAEALCASMCIEGSVDAVITEDSDVMCYGTPYLLCKWSGEECVVLSKEEMLKGLDLSFESFRDLCILLSCDYNDRVKGYPPDGVKRKKPVNIGAKKAVEIIRAYRSLEVAEPFLENPEVLKYERCRELFTPPDTSFLPPPKIRNIDLSRLSKLWKKHKVSLDFEKVCKVLKPTDVVLDVDVEV